MTTTQHPLTETEAISLFGTDRFGSTLDEWWAPFKDEIVKAMRAAFDAGREHERTTPTPPAVEVEMPTERPAHLLDVVGPGGEACAYMALDFRGSWCGVDQDGSPRVWYPIDFTAFTLPDGTRARRDGEHEDGTPRFVKVQEGEK